MAVKKPIFSQKQERVLLWWRGKDRSHDAIICDGAIRSGKTLCLGISFVSWAMHCFQEQRFALCGQSVVSVRRNVLYELKGWLERLGFTVTEHRSDGYLEISRGRRRNRFYLFGGYDESSADRIQGITLAGVLLDEVALMPRSFVEQACARCSVPGSRLWFSCNPAGPGHWFYREWICRAEERNALYLHFTMEDNPGISPGIRQRYERMYSGVFYQRFVLGEWAATEGRVYDFFRRETMVAEAPEGTMEQYMISVDYGTVNPTSMGLWGLRQGVWYRMKEYYYDSKRSGRQKTDAEYVDELRRLAGDKAIRRIIVDPSAASFITALRKAGFSVSPADNEVLSGIRKTADLLQQGKLVICQSCEDCLREIEEYVWDEKKNGQDCPKKENDHAMDEMRYFANYVSKSRSARTGCWAGCVERRLI